jgi:hypothetical protein
VSNREDGVGDGDIAGLEAGIALDYVGIDSGHCGRITENEDVAVPVAHTKDGVVGLHPDTGAMAHKEVRATQADACGDGHQGQEKQEQTITPCCVWRRYVRGMSRAGSTILLCYKDRVKRQICSCIHVVRDCRIPDDKPFDGIKVY